MMNEEYSGGSRSNNKDGAAAANNSGDVQVAATATGGGAPSPRISSSGGVAHHRLSYLENRMSFQFHTAGGGNGGGGNGGGGNGGIDGGDTGGAWDDRTTTSTVTMDEDLLQPGNGSGRSSLTTKHSLRGGQKIATNGSIIVPRTSFEARLSSKSKELTLSTLRIDKLPLFGRDAELQALVRAVDQVVISTPPPAETAQSNVNIVEPQRQGRRGLLLVNGLSGAGKSSLIQHSSVQRTIQSNGGLYIYAKCDLRQEDEPFASIQDAMSVLCAKILQLRRRSSTGVDGFGTSSFRSLSTGLTGGVGGDGHGVDKRGSLSELPEISDDTSSTAANTHRSQESSSGTSGASLEDVQHMLHARLDYAEWKVLVQTVPAVEELLVGNETGLGLGTGNDDGNGDADIIEDQVAATSSAPPGNRASSLRSSTGMSGSSLKENSDQLKYACRHFIRTVASAYPLVMVFDDCQWLDHASMEWIKSILTDVSSSAAATNRTSKEPSSEIMHVRENDDPRLLIVASYRTDEVGEDHDLMKMVKEVRSLTPQLPSDHTQESAVNAEKKKDMGVEQNHAYLLKEISVGNLQIGDVVALLLELLNEHEEQVQELAHVLYKKTGGNAFFLVQFLLRLQEDRKLCFSIGLMKWTWDCNEIRESYTATENVADILTDRMQKSTVALEILPTAACLGSTFSPGLLQKVVEGVHSDETPNGTKSVSRSLEKCISEGYLEVTSDLEYRFCHDKILETALKFLDKDAKVRIGDFFLERFDKESGGFGDAFYSAVNVVNEEANSLATTEHKKRRIAEMNAVAGEKALQLAAFEAAGEFLENAMKFLPADHWASQKDLSLNIYVMAGAAAFCAGTGHQDNVKVYTDEVMAQKHVPLLDKMELCFTMMDTYDTAFTNEANLTNYEFGRQILADFDCTFPTSALGVGIKTLSGLAKAKMQLKKKLSSQALDSKPIVTDRRVLMIMKVLDKFTSAVFHCKGELLPLVILKMAKYTDRFGLTPAAAISYPLLGLLFGSLDDFETAKVCANAGLAILKRCGNDSTVLSRVYMYVYFYSLHWSVPIKDCLKPLLEGYRVGMTAGTLYGAFFCIYFYLEFNFWTSTQLSALHADCVTYLQQMEDYQQMKHAVVLNFLRHMVARLLGFADGSEEVEYEALCQETGDLPVICALRRTQMVVRCFLGEHEKVAELSLEWQPTICKVLVSQVNTLEVTFVSAMSCMAVLRQSPPAHRNQKYMKMAAKCRKKIKSWVAKSCPNCVAHEGLLDAEWAILTKEKGNPMVRYEQAILLSGRRGLTHLQALANERLAIYMEEVGDGAEALYRYEQAYNLYSEWGAQTKVEQLHPKIDMMKKDGASYSSRSFRGVTTVAK